MWGDCEKAWLMVSLKGQGLLPSSQRWHDIAVSCRFSEKTTNPGKKKKHLKISANSYGFYWVPTTILKSSDVTSFPSHDQ